MCVVCVCVVLCCVVLCCACVCVCVCVSHHLTGGSYCATPPPKPQSCKVRITRWCSHVRTEAQIKFLYYPLSLYLVTHRKRYVLWHKKLKNFSFIQSCKLLTYKAVDLHCHILTHYSPVLLSYIPWKHQKTFRFSDVFRGYRKATPGRNGLIFILQEKHIYHYILL